MTMFPRSTLTERRQALLRRVGFFASGLMVLLVVAIFAFVVRSERAHDEARCPFTTLGERTLAGATVIEESRRCVPEAEEHRWLLVRGGGAKLELGRKRLPRASFAAERTKWKLREDETQRLVLEIEVDGAPFSDFREADLRAP